MKKTGLWFVLSFCLCSQIDAARLYAVFSGMALQVDTQIESPATNSGGRSLSPPEAGGAIRFQVFVPEAAGKKTLGFNLVFGLVGGTYYDYLGEAGGTAFDGSQLLPVLRASKVSALMLSAPPVPASGYLGTVEIPIRKKPLDGMVFAVKVATMGDTNSDEDALNTANAAITLTESIPPIAGDLNLDGSVDFSDFLVFAQNFGKTGPVPTPPSFAAPLPVLVHIRDTVTVVKRDTVYVQVQGPPPPPEPTPTPNPPTGVTYTYNPNPPTVTLSWTPPQAFDGFLIQRAAYPTGAPPAQMAWVIIRALHTGTTYTDTDVAPGNTYVYRIATNIKGQISAPTGDTIVNVP